MKYSMVKRRNDKSRVTPNASNDGHNRGTFLDGNVSPELCFPSPMTKISIRFDNWRYVTLKRCSLSSKGSGRDPFGVAAFDLEASTLPRGNAFPHDAAYLRSTNSIWSLWLRLSAGYTSCKSVLHLRRPSCLNHPFIA